MEMYDMKGPPTHLVPAQLPTPFSDQAVPQEVASALRQIAERIRRFGDQQNKAIVAIGRELAAAKELLPSDLFGPWIRKEFGMADETAGAYVAATRQIAADPESEGCGTAEIELPSGSRLACPIVDASGPISAYVDPGQPDYVNWPEIFFPSDFGDDILAQIREFDSRASKADRSSGDTRDSGDLRSSSAPAFDVCDSGDLRSSSPPAFLKTD